MGTGEGREGFQSHRPGVRKLSANLERGVSRFALFALVVQRCLRPANPQCQGTAAETGARHGSSLSLSGAAKAEAPVEGPCLARVAQARGVFSANLLPSLSRLLRRSERRDSSLRSVEIVSAAAASPLRASCARCAPPPSDTGEEEPIRPPCCTSRAYQPAGHQHTRYQRGVRPRQGSTTLLQRTRRCCCMPHRDESPAGLAAGAFLTCCPNAINRDNPFIGASLSALSRKYFDLRNNFEPGLLLSRTKPV